MSFGRIALWIVGPTGSGKSTLAERSLPPEFRLVDQDRELERRLLARGLPLDARARNAAQAAAFLDVRGEATAATWSLVPSWRRDGVPIAFEVSGDKRHLLQEQLDLDAAAGYRDLGVVLRVPVELCLARNAVRARVVPEAIVRNMAVEVERNLSGGVYQSMFAAGDLVVVADVDAFDIGRWLAGRDAKLMP